MPTTKLTSGRTLPFFALPLVGGGQATLGQPEKAGNWHLVFVETGYPVRGTYE